MTRNERIKFILEKEKISYDRIAEVLGVTKQAIANRLNRDKEIEDKDFIQAVSSVAHVSHDMLYHGTGFHEYVFKIEAYESNPDIVIRPNEKDHIITDLKGKIYGLESENLFLKKQLYDKDERVSELKERIEELKEALKEAKEALKKK